MFAFNKAVIYSSKDQLEWEKKQEILKNAGIEFQNFVNEELPLVGCGAKIDPRDFASKKERSKTIYQILVDKKFKELALKLINS